MQELCDEVDVFIEEYLNELANTEQTLGITNFFPSKTYENCFQLLSVGKYFCDKILKFTDEFNFENGKSDWHIFNRIGDRIEIRTAEKTLRYDACTHAVFHIERDDSVALILWRDDPYNNHKDEDGIMFSERRRWNAEMTFQWLVKELIPQVAWHYEEIYDYNKEENWLDLWDRFIQNGNKKDNWLALWNQVIQNLKKSPGHFLKK